MYKEKRYILQKKLTHKYHCQNYFNSITIKYIQEVEMELMPELFLWKLGEIQYINKKIHVGTIILLCIPRNASILLLLITKCHFQE